MAPRFGMLRKSFADNTLAVTRNTDNMIVIKSRAIVCAAGWVGAALRLGSLMGALP